MSDAHGRPFRPVSLFFRQTLTLGCSVRLVQLRSRQQHTDRGDDGQSLSLLWRACVARMAARCRITIGVWLVRQNGRSSGLRVTRSRRDPSDDVWKMARLAVLGYGAVTVGYGYREGLVPHFRLSGYVDRKPRGSRDWGEKARERDFGFDESWFRRGSSRRVAIWFGGP